MKIDYLICGVRISFESALPIVGDEESDRFLALPGDEDIQISIDCVEQIPTPEGMYCKSNREHPVYRSGDNICRCSWDLFRENPHMRVDYRLGEPRSVRCYIRRDDWNWATKGSYLWPGIALQSLLLYQKAIMLHASYIVHEGEGIIFTASSGVGKSTQAALWQQFRNAIIVNGDKAAIRIGKKVMCHGVPVSGTSGISNNISVPLKGIVILSQSDDNEANRMSIQEAVPLLYRNIFIDSAIPEENQMVLKLILEILNTIPVYQLSCTPDERAIVTLEKMFENEM